MTNNKPFNTEIVSWYLYYKITMNYGCQRKTKKENEKLISGIWNVVIVLEIKTEQKKSEKQEEET